jgi:hypothetical protein
MRVAICLSGQLRTWRKCHESWELLFKRFKEQIIRNHIFLHSEYVDEPFEIDYFIHTWDFNTLPHYQWGVDFNAPHSEEKKKLLEKFDTDHTLISPHEIDEVLNLLKPKNHIVEGWDVSYSRKKIMDDIAISQPFNNSTHSPLSWAASQFYSILRSAQLKREYEIKNNFEYDMCIRLRFDINFDENNRMLFVRDFEKPKPRTVYTVHNGILNTYPFDIIGDIFYYSDSLTFDLLSSLYDNIPYIRNTALRDSALIEEMITYMVRMFQLNNHKTNLNPQVVRE